MDSWFIICTILDLYSFYSNKQDLIIKYYLLVRFQSEPNNKFLLPTWKIGYSRKGTFNCSKFYLVKILGQQNEKNTPFGVYDVIMIWS